LNAIRSAIVFMVRFGFSLAEVRQLMIDEFFSFHKALISILESQGIVKEGTSDNIQDEDVVFSLKKQLRKLKKS